MNFRSFVTTSIRNPIRIHLKNCNQSNKLMIDKSKQNTKNLGKDWRNSSLFSVAWIRRWTSTSKHLISRITSHQEIESFLDNDSIRKSNSGMTDYYSRTLSCALFHYSIHPIWKLFQLKSKLSNVTPPVYCLAIPTPKPLSATML